MTDLLDFLPTDLTYAFGWTVIHSLWQGGFLMLMIMLINKVFKPAANVKYWTAISTLCIMLIVSVITFAMNFHITNSELFLTQSSLLAINNMPLSQEFNISAILSEYLPAIALLWFGGMFFYSIKLIGGFAQVYRLKNVGVSEIPKQWEKHVTRLIESLSIKRAVKVMESIKVEVPMVLGFFKPMILMPIGMMSSLSSDQVEAIILHELAHIKRNDFLMNSIQSVIEVIFYYHPAVWWISSQARIEREHCCDDQTISSGVDKVIYARALTNVRTTSFTQNKLTMGLANNKNDLLNRIKRMVEGKEHSTTSIYSRGIPLLLLLTILMSFTWYRADNVPTEDVPVTTNNFELMIKPVLEEFIPEPPMPLDSPRVKSKSKTTVIWTDENGEVHEVTKESSDDDNDWEFMEENLSEIKEHLDVLKDIDFDLDNSFVFDFLDDLDSPLIHKEHMMRIEEELARTKEHLEGMHLKFDFNDDDFSDEEIRDIKEKMHKMERVMRERSSSLNQTERERREERDQLRSMRDREREIHRRELRSSEREFSTQEMQERMKEIEKAHQEREEEMKEMEKGFQLYEKELSKQLRADGYLKKGEDVDNFEMRDGAMKVNGKDIDSKHAMKYKKLKAKYLD